MGRLSMAEIHSAFEKEQEEFFQKNKKKDKKVTKPPLREYPQIRFTPSGKPISVWARKVEPQAFEQASWFSELPFIHPKGLALMPDVHAGKGVPVGSVIPTLGALVPSAVGVDIGCGMAACRLNIKRTYLKDNLKQLRRRFEVALGIDNGGVHKQVESFIMDAWKPFEEEWKQRKERFPRASKENPFTQLGTLGGGNHFLELCTDDDGYVWILVHTGSRGSGAVIGQFFIEQAHRRTKETGEMMVQGLGWIPDEDPFFTPYIDGMNWAQNFAKVNRAVIIKIVLNILNEFTGQTISITGEAIECHHNYVAKETHYGEELWITRKGAIRAGIGEWGIIPSHMGGETLIVKGKGHKKSWCSCSHGAGRSMTRTAAKERFTVEDLKKSTIGVECRKERSIIDEIPMAYKPFQQVIEDQRDLVEIQHKLKAFLCVKEPS